MFFYPVSLSLSLSHFLSLFLFVSALADAYRYLRKDEEIESEKSWRVRVGKCERAYWKYEKEKKAKNKWNELHIQIKDEKESNVRTS